MGRNCGPRRRYDGTMDERKGGLMCEVCDGSDRRTSKLAVWKVKLAGDPILGISGDIFCPNCGEWVGPFEEFIGVGKPVTAQIHTVH